MLCKLAWGNVRRAGRDYTVYLLTLTLAVTVFYAFNTISVQIDYVTMEEGLSELLGGTMSGLTLFLAVVMGFLMVYANNFIMKRRKKEFGLCQVLGMSRGQVARVMALETAIVSGVALALGIALGVGFSQIMTFFTASLFRTQISDFHFFFSLEALGITAGCLVAVFLVTLLFNLRVVGRAKVIDLMSAERKNEAVKTRNPWLAAIVFVVGAVLIGIAYARLLRDGLPIDATPDEMGRKTTATVMVVAGSILFFFGLSGFLLKVLQSVRGVYWRGLNMFTLRQLSSKVNTVSFSMAVIAMILFLAITSVTGGMSIADAMNSNIDRGSVADYSRTFSYYTSDQVDSINEHVAAGEGNWSPAALATSTIDMMDASSQNVMMDKEKQPTDEHFDLARIVGTSVQTNVYDSQPAGADAPLVSLRRLCDLTGITLPMGMANSDATTGLQVMKESDYNAYLRFRGMDEVDLGSNGYLLTCDLGDSVARVYNAVLSKGMKIDFGDTQLTPGADHVNADASTFSNTTMGDNAGTIIVPDELVEKNGLLPYASYLLVDYKDGLSEDETDGYVRRALSFGTMTDADGNEFGTWGVSVTRTEIHASANTMNGLISYLAIYIGFVLVVACAAILAIQQLSGVADSGKSCRVLSELGTPHAQIMRSALVQQLVLFGFPLLLGIAHSIVALHVVIEIVEVFGGLSIGGTVGLTCGIFLLAYGGYFVVTYLMSKGIVADAIRVRHTA